MAIQAKEDNTIRFQTRCGKVIEQFLKGKGKNSKNTEKFYRTDIEGFLEVVFNGKTIDTITAEEIETLDFDKFEMYIDSLQGKANTTINRHISTIKSMIKFLKGMGVIDKLDLSFLTLISLLPNDSTRIEGMTRAVVMNYISEAGREKNHPKVKEVLIILAVDAALRMEDYIDMKWSQFSPQEEYVILSGYGKGNKRWIEKISHEVYNKVLELKKGQTAEETRVFSPLNKKNITDMMSRMKTNLGYHDRAYSFHSFKKTATTFTYRLTGDILEAMKKAKHERIETTRIYLEEEDYGMTGMFSVGDYDAQAYKNVSYDVLMESLDMLNKDTLHLLNLKIKQLEKNSN